MDELEKVFWGGGEFVVIVGAFVKQQQQYGPFYNFDVARTWASDYFGHNEWYVKQLMPPPKPPKKE